MEIRLGCYEKTIRAAIRPFPCISPNRPTPSNHLQTRGLKRYRIRENRIRRKTRPSRTTSSVWSFVWKNGRHNHSSSLMPVPSEPSGLNASRCRRHHRRRRCRPRVSHQTSGNERASSKIASSVAGMWDAGAFMEVLHECRLNYSEIARHIAMMPWYNRLNIRRTEQSTLFLRNRCPGFYLNYLKLSETDIKSAFSSLVNYLTIFTIDTHDNTEIIDSNYTFKNFLSIANFILKNGTVLKYRILILTFTSFLILDRMKCSLDMLSYFN